MINESALSFRLSIMAKDVLMECVPTDLMGMPSFSGPRICTVLRSKFTIIVEVTLNDLFVSPM